MKIIFPIAILFILFGSCAEKKAKKQAEIDDNILKQYITDKGLTAIPTGTGLYYVIDTQGAGQSCNSNSDVKVYYKGYFTNGEVFDESTTDGITFNLQQVIPGWTEGIPYFKQGGIGKLLIPSALGYGQSGNSSIPKNSVLIFDIKLIEVL